MRILLFRNRLLKEL